MRKRGDQDSKHKQTHQLGNIKEYIMAKAKKSAEKAAKKTAKPAKKAASTVTRGAYTQRGKQLYS